MMEFQQSLFGFPIRCRATVLDDGLHVLLTGGCNSHIGAITVSEPGMVPETKTFPGHKDRYVSEPWAAALSEKTRRRVCVVCGIHYDHAAPEQIEAILKVTQELLRQLLDALPQSFVKL